MKNVMTCCILVVLLLLGAGCAHTPEKDAALLLAGGVSMRLVESDFAGQEVFTGVPCALLAQEGLLITAINRKSGNSMKDYVLPDKQPRSVWSENKPIFLPPGKHTITVLLGSRANDPQASLTFTFEKGKHYTLDYVLYPNKVNFTFGEITDEAKLAELAKEVAEKQKRSKEKAESLAYYLSFSKENPEWLKGKWSTGKEKDELEFSGNTIKYVAVKRPFYDTRTTLEGVFLFNKDSMIIQWNLFRTSANTLTRKERPDFLENLPVYYTLHGDTLVVSHGGILPFNISGTYQRVR